MASLREHFLIGAFADYYQELATAKREIGAGKLANYLGVRATEKAPDDRQLLGILHRRLKAKLVQQQRSIRASASALEQRDYIKVLYAACALTDEQFLFDVEWKEQEKDKQKIQELWQQEFLMERAFFSTEDAGFRIFENIQEIIKDRSKVSNRSDLAAVYLLSITLGFQGKYRGWDQGELPESFALDSDSVSQEIVSDQQNKDNQETEQSRGDQQEQSEQDALVQEASSQFKEKTPLDIEKEALYMALDTPLQQDQVFPQAYKHLLYVTEDPDVHRIAPMRRWYKYMALAVIGYLVLSSAVWLYLTNGLSEQIDSLKTPNSCEQFVKGGSGSENANKPEGQRCSD